MIKEMIAELNRAMIDDEISFRTVLNLCEQISKLTGLKYCIQNKRVCYKDNLGHYHDAWVNC